MNALDYLLTYIDKAHGNNRAKAAKALGIEYPTFAAICNGTRGVSSKMARKLSLNSHGQLDPGRLVFIRANPDKAA